MEIEELHFFSGLCRGWFTDMKMFHMPWVCFRNRTFYTRDTRALLWLRSTDSLGNPTPTLQQSQADVDNGMVCPTMMTLNHIRCILYYSSYVSSFHVISTSFAHFFATCLRILFPVPWVAKVILGIAAWLDARLQGTQGSPLRLPNGSQRFPLGKSQPNVVIGMFILL